MFQFRCRGGCSSSDVVEDVPVLMSWKMVQFWCRGRCSSSHVVAVSRPMMYNFQILSFSKFHSMTFGSMPLLNPTWHNAALNVLGSLFFNIIWCHFLLSINWTVTQVLHLLFALFCHSAPCMLHCYCIFEMKLPWSESAIDIILSVLGYIGWVHLPYYLV